MNSFVVSDVMCKPTPMISAAGLIQVTALNMIDPFRQAKNKRNPVHYVTPEVG